MKYAKLQKEELKNKVADEFFGKFDCTEILEKIDFAVAGRQQTADGSFFGGQKQKPILRMFVKCSHNSS